MDTYMNEKQIERDSKFFSKFKPDRQADCVVWVLSGMFMNKVLGLAVLRQRVTTFVVSMIE